MSPYLTVSISVYHHTFNLDSSFIRSHFLHVLLAHLCLHCCLEVPLSHAISCISQQHLHYVPLFCGRHHISYHRQLSLLFLLPCHGLLAFHYHGFFLKYSCFPTTFYEPAVSSASRFFSLTFFHHLSSYHHPWLLLSWFRTICYARHSCSLVTSAYCCVLPCPSLPRIPSSCLVCFPHISLLLSLAPSLVAPPYVFES